jgi:hypothetical protein
MESGCQDDSPECWCPCGCGCQNDPQGGDLPFRHTKGNDLPTGVPGMCLTCAKGQHEVPPGRNIDDLIAAHESILRYLHSY